MLKAKDGDFFISDWLRNRNTVEFLGIWESVHNPDFNYGEFATIRTQAGLNSYKISVKEWVEQTNAIGLRASAGRYGGTYAHRDIAFEFGMWISPEFKVYLIKEFQRLKDEENDRLRLGQAHGPLVRRPRDARPLEGIDKMPENPQPAALCSTRRRYPQLPSGPDQFCSSLLAAVHRYGAGHERFLPAQ